MSPLVCRGCTNRLPATNAGVDIFSEDASSSSIENDNSVKRGIELITGLAVSGTDGLPGRLCRECNSKVEEFLAFRTQLLTSLRVFSSPGYSSKKSDELLEAGSSLSTMKNNSIVTNINFIDEDVESDIDVCSGEDDGVLELDVQSKKDEIYEIESSDESDIQVCDYEPNGV